jgi:Cdc6-like AAA superfamily ATPase
MAVPTSRYRALFRILEQLGRTVDVHRQSTPQDVLLERLRKYDDDCVVVLDEADQLDNKGIIYDLRQPPQFTLVLIANQEENLFGDVDERLQSRLHGTQTIQFDPYGVDQLVAILQARADAAFAHPDAITTGLLQEIADAAAGDARVAITILREAAKAADRTNRNHITSEEVEAAIPEGRQAVRNETKESLKPTQRTLYESRRSACRRAWRGNAAKHTLRRLPGDRRRPGWQSTGTPALEQTRALRAYRHPWVFTRPPLRPTEYRQQSLTAKPAILRHPLN